MSNLPDAEKLACPRCSTELAPADHFCRNCGMAVDRAASEPALDAAIVAAEVAEDVPPGKKRLSESVGFVLSMLFLLLGPLAFPMLWRSGAFTRAWKIVLTIVVTLYAAAMLWLCWFLCMRMILDPMREMFEMYPRGY